MALVFSLATSFRALYAKIEAKPLWQLLADMSPEELVNCIDFTYITDAKTFPETSIEKIKGSKVLVLNALHHREHHSHLNLKQAVDFIQLVQPEQAFLVHISHNMGLHDDVNNNLPKNVFLAYDGLTLEL